MGDQENLNESDIQKYMFASEDAVTNDDWKKYLISRYNQIVDEYKMLIMYKREAEQQKKEDSLGKLMKAFGENYQARVWVVKALRVTGALIEDKLVP